LFHWVVVAVAFTVVAWQVYPDETGAVWHRQRRLAVLYRALEEWRGEHGCYPADLAGLHVVEGGIYHFGPKRLDGFGIGNPDALGYELAAGKPVLTDLGLDCRPGGMGHDLDASYPPEFQQAVRFADFIATRYFVSTAAWGAVLATAISVCLYGIWRERLGATKHGLAKAVVFSTGFLGFELFLAHLIMYAHIYSHH
jgi:hypothetical protein